MTTDMKQGPPRGALVKELDPGAGVRRAGPLAQCGYACLVMSSMLA